MTDGQYGASAAAAEADGAGGSSYERVIPERRAYYEKISHENLAPLWEELHVLVPAQPHTPVKAVKWDYDEVRPLLMEAGGLITADEAERRVLMLRNPGLGGQAAITQSLYGGFQLILPGEVARTHRHSQSALRFIIEGEGAYTTVGGEKIPMRPGDLVLTPSWNWHDHGNDTDKPMVWLDGLDIPLISFFEAGFFEAANVESQEPSQPLGDSLARFGSGLAPVDWRPKAKASPMLHYSYERTREVLEAMRRADPADPCHGWKMRYINPTSGGSPMATIGAFIQMLPPGEATAPYRSTDATVFAVVEGSGTSTIGDVTIEWKPRDVFVAPSWVWQSHHAHGEATLFSFSDRPVQQVLDLWREERRVPA